MKIRKVIFTFTLFIIFIISISSCATVRTEKRIKSKHENKISQPFPEYQGTKKRVQIIRFGVPKYIADMHPELADKRVGWGLYNRLINAFYETNRFEFVEEKETIIKKMVDQWALSQTGLVAEEQEIKSDGLSAPEYLIYAEVFDFAVSHEETIVGVAMEKKNATIIGIQLRVVDVKTGEYVPASGSGEAETISGSVWINPGMSFDQSTVGIATEKAVNSALRSLIKRMK